MSLELTRASDSRSLAEFVNLPFSLHKTSPFWTPTLKKQELALLSPGQHPFWESAQRELFLARRAGKPVGRIAAIIDHKHNAYHDEKAGVFGFFEAIPDQDVAAALLDKASMWLRANGMTHMRGPFNPSTNYTCGMLVQGFEEQPAVMMPWNPPDYPAMLEKWGMRKEEDLLAYVIDRDCLHLSGWLKAEVERLKAEGRFTCRPSSRATLKGDIKAMLDIYQASWAGNWGFSPLSGAEAANIVRELKSVIDPGFFVLFFHQDEPAAGMVALPNLTPLLKRLNGRLGLSSPWHLWHSRKEVRRGLRIMLFGIMPQYRLQGLPLLLLDYMLEKARARPELQWVEGSWILEGNSAMNDLLEDFSGQILKRYRIYRKELGPCQLPA